MVLLTLQSLFSKFVDKDMQLLDLLLILRQYLFHLRIVARLSLHSAVLALRITTLCSRVCGPGIL